MNQTCITIVIVSYKSAELTVDSLKSVLAEKSRCNDLKVNVVVVDNASGDTPHIAQAIEAEGWSDWVVLLTAPHNGGFGYGNNYGFQYALNHWHVDYFHLLNPDAQFKPGGLSVLVDFMQAHESVGIAGSSFETQDGKAWPYAFRFPGMASEFDSALNLGFIARLLKNKTLGKVMGDQPEKIDWVAGASMMMRRSVVEELRGFDESYFLYYEETDLCLRAKRAGYETWYVPESRVMHILGQSTKVTEISDKPKRLPTYWFESRTSYFIKNYGVFTTIMIDLARLVGSVFGGIKRLIKRIFLNKKEDVVPYYIVDLLANSPLLLTNIKKKPFVSPLK